MDLSTVFYAVVFAGFTGIVYRKWLMHRRFEPAYDESMERKKKYMMFVYQPQGVCSREFHFEIQDGVIQRFQKGLGIHGVTFSEGDSCINVG